MAITYVTGTVVGSHGNAAVTTAGINTTGADLIVVGLHAYNDAFSSDLSDSRGNTWTKLTARGTSGSCVVLYYCAAPVVGSGHTFTAPAGHGAPSGYHTVTVAAFAGTNASPYEAESGTTGSASPTRPGSLTPAANGAVVVTGVTWYPSGTVSVDGSFTIVGQVDYSAGNAMGGALAYLIQTSAAAANPGWSHSTGFTEAAVAQAVFKAAAGGGGNRRRRVLICGGT